MNNIAFLLVVVLAAGVLWYVLRGKRPTAPVDLSILPERFIVFDLETTGLDPTKHEIIEIAAIRVNRDSDVHQTFQGLVKPKKKVPQRITEITSITQEMLDRDGQSLESALAEFAAFIGDLRLISFNVEFDMAFLRNAATQSGLTLRNPTSCALKMARRAWPGRKSYRLVDLAKDGGLSTAGAHRALHDCRAAMTVYTSAAVTLRSVT